MELGDILISESDIARAIAELAAEISADYGDADILLLGVMDGAICFLPDLARALPNSADMTTLRASSYNGAQPGDVTMQWLPPRSRIEGRRALIVEGIVDTGATVKALMEKITEMGAASVEICALLDKPSRRVHEVEVAYIGFDIPDSFVVGYGLDYNGKYRNLRDLREMRE